MTPTVHCHQSASRVDLRAGAIVAESMPL